jgi:hypothetical protein
VTGLAIIRLTDEEQVWLGRWVERGEEVEGKPCYGQVVALAPKPGHVWVCDGHTFTEVATSQLARGLTVERFTPHRRADNSPIPHLPLPVDTAVDNEEAEAP